MDEMRKTFEKFCPYIATRFEIWKAAVAWHKKQPVDPWQCAPKEPGKYRLHVKENSKWYLSKFLELTNTWRTICEGYNCDISRDGEVRTYNPETGEFEK